jgi:hypothetical protein
MVNYEEKTIFRLYCGNVRGRKEVTARGMAGTRNQPSPVPVREGCVG